MSAAGGTHPVPAEGVVLSGILARQLRVDVGELVGVELLEGPEAGERVVVTGAPALMDGSPVEIIGEDPPETAEDPKKKRPAPDGSG